MQGHAVTVDIFLITAAALPAPWSEQVSDILLFLAGQHPSRLPRPFFFFGTSVALLPLELRADPIVRCLLRAPYWLVQRHTVPLPNVIQGSLPVSNVVNFKVNIVFLSLALGSQ